MYVFTYSEKNNIPNAFVKEKEIAGRAWVEVLHRNPMNVYHESQNLNLLATDFFQILAHPVFKM